MKSALVIDDDPLVGELVRILLESRGFEVEVLSDGIDALELKRTYDVILLDVNMPVFDGERLIAYWKLTQAGILRRVIILSGYSKLTGRIDLPAYATLPKPFEHADLVRVVDACVAQSDAV